MHLTSTTDQRNPGVALIRDALLSWGGGGNDMLGFRYVDNHSAPSHV